MKMLYLLQERVCELNMTSVAPASDQLPLNSGDGEQGFCVHVCVFVCVCVCVCAGVCVCVSV